MSRRTQLKRKLFNIFTLRMFGNEKSLKTIKIGRHEIRLKDGIPIQELPKEGNYISFFTANGQEIILQFSNRQETEEAWKSLL